jgi:hypothetical protein
MDPRIRIRTKMSWIPALLFTQKISLSMLVGDPGSDILDAEKTYPGSRILGAKSTGSAFATLVPSYQIDTCI